MQFWIGRDEHADHRHRAAEKCNELAPPHTRPRDVFTKNTTFGLIGGISVTGSLMRF
jgi:hypothetical protein